MSEITLRRLKPGDPDIAQIVGELNVEERWGEYENKFSASSLAEFLKDETRIYLLAYIGDQIAGASHAYLYLHPSGKRYLYIDEVDTSTSFRRQGVATAMMRELLRLGAEQGADEAWLGTEDDNEPAKALYDKFSPSEVEHGPIYTFKTKSDGD